MIVTCECGESFEIVLKEEQAIIEIEKEHNPDFMAKKARIDYLEGKIAFIKACTPNICPRCMEAHVELEKKKIISSGYGPEQPNYEQMGIMAEHYQATLENWTPRTDEDVKILSSCRAMLSSRKGIIVMLGPNGTGKTHLSAALLKEIGGKYFRWNRLTAWINSGYKTDAGFSAYEALENLGKLHLLVIDEVDKSRGTEANTNYLSDIIDDRYARRKPTILISNFHQTKNCAATRGMASKFCPQCFEPIMSPDILDRIKQVGVILNFSGESYRKELRGK